MHCIYLHGFASGPSSTKARFFAERLGEAGIEIEIPDLNVPHFEAMTLTEQLSLVESLVSVRSDVLLVGSSMGGLIATLISTRAEARKKIAGMILLAPGFGLNRRWRSILGDGALERWREQGYLEVFHYGFKRKLRLGHDFLEDMSTHSSEDIRIDCATLILHGRNDEVVPLEESIRFRDLNPSVVDLIVLEDDHQLLNKLPEVWYSSEKFIKKLTGNR